MNSRARKNLLVTKDCRLSPLRSFIESEASVLFIEDKIYFKTFGIRSSAFTGKSAIADLSCSCVWADVDIPQIQMQRNLSEAQPFFKNENFQTPPTSTNTVSKVRFGNFESLEDQNRPIGQLVIGDEPWDEASPKKNLVLNDALGILISYPPATPDIFKSKIQSFNHSVLGFAVSERESLLTLYGFLITSVIAALLGLFAASLSFPLKAFGTATVLIIISFAAVSADLGAFFFRSHSVLGLSICTHVCLGYLAVGTFVAALMGNNNYLDEVVMAISIILVLTVAVHLLLIGSLSSFLNTDNIRLILTEQENEAFPIPRLFVANIVH
eukprot:GHVP01068847.1.p1 GENE.GHVP01068847.1~~GHVP01068847.1.p1  ORF type:complete len:326 (+),score=57.24 GHVP01068847.1:1192-2169(+)